MKGPGDHLWLRRFLSLLILTAVWEVLSRIGIIDAFYAPAPSEILRVVFSLFAEGTILNHLEATFAAALSGLVIGLALGIVLGFAAALVPLIADVLEPLMMLLNAIPRVILAPLFVIWLGIELPSKIALAVVQDRGSVRTQPTPGGTSVDARGRAHDSFARGLHSVRYRVGARQP